MEMNTRLQVEHPVTEAITGQDLVEWQLRVASGEALPLRQDELGIKGWAVEARLYAEDPSNEFLPSTGRLDYFTLGEGIRIDSGVEEGDRISPFYDPMIAKLIAHGDTRSEAIAKLAGAMTEVEIWPVKTNAAFLFDALIHPEFNSGEIDTGFIPRHLDRLVRPAEPPDEVWNLAAGSLLEAGMSRSEPAGGQGPWQALAGFRLNADEDLRIALQHGSEIRTIDLSEPYEWAAGSVALGEELIAFFQGQAFAFALPGRAGSSAGGAAADGSLVSPMPGRVISVDVRQGDRVAKGQKMLTLEAMKMEHSLVAPFEGVVAELDAVEGAQVSEGTLLARVEKGE